MSTIADARPNSRRAFLTAAAAGTVAATGTLGAHAALAVAAEPDPVLALIDAERAAWTRFEDLSLAYSRAEDAFTATGWNRKPRVLVGESTVVARGPGYHPVPLSEQVATPVYVHTHGAINADCDAYGREATAEPAEVEARRARLHRDLDQDIAAVAARQAPVDEAERLSDEALEVWKAASATVAVATPLTVKGLLAMMDRIVLWTDDGMFELDQDAVENVFVHARSFLSGRA